MGGILAKCTGLHAEDPGGAVNLKSELIPFCSACVPPENGGGSRGLRKGVNFVMIQKKVTAPHQLRPIHTLMWMTAATELCVAKLKGHKIPSDTIELLEILSFELRRLDVGLKRTMKKFQAANQHRNTIFHLKTSLLHALNDGKKRLYEERRKEANSKISERDLRAIVFSRDMWKCKNPECKRGYPLTIDHIIPVVAGGSDELENLQTLCGRCNSRKGRKLTRGVSPSIPLSALCAKELPTVEELDFPRHAGCNPSKLQMITFLDKKKDDGGIYQAEMKRNAALGMSAAKALRDARRSIEGEYGVRCHRIFTKNSDKFIEWYATNMTASPVEIITKAAEANKGTDEFLQIFTQEIVEINEERKSS